MITVAAIQQAAASTHKIPVETMKAREQRREFAWPRQEAMFLSRDMIRLYVNAGKQGHRISLPEIGRRFGNRDHTTVIHALRAVEKRIANDAEVRRRIDALSVRLLVGDCATFVLIADRALFHAETGR